MNIGRNNPQFPAAEEHVSGRHRKAYRLVALLSVTGRERTHHSSLDTLAKIATAMEIPLAQFFSGGTSDNGNKNVPKLAEDEVRFLTQIRRYSPNLNDSDRKLVIAMVKKMAASTGK